MMTGREQKFWSRLGKILLWGGGGRYPGVGNVLSVGGTSISIVWFSMSEEVTRIVEGNHVLFIRQITGIRVQRTTDITWETPAAGEVLKSSGIHTAATYFD